MLVRVASEPLLSRARSGDPSARDELVRVHGPRVYALCRRLAPDPEDCYQEIWEKVLGALSSFDPAGAATFGGWVHTIARRHLTDRHRRRVVRGQVVSLHGLSAGEEAADERVIRRQREERLEEALMCLPVDQREVVVLHHIHGIGLDEIASDLETSVGTVKSRLHRGRARLAEMLRRGVAGGEG